jgi:carboxyl-terminal processing protease
MKARLLLVTTLCCLFFVLHAVEASDKPLSLRERVSTASRIYADIHTYFGHWQGIPSFDLDAEYSAYLDQILSTESRKSFDLATMAFMAKLQNGHTGFRDAWLQDTFGQELNFYAYPVDGQWVIVRSKLPELKAGDTISTLDAMPFQVFYESKRQYISGSNERWRMRAFFEYPYLFPESFELALGDGRHVTVHRNDPFHSAGAEARAINTTLHDGVLLIKIPAFSPSNFEAEAVHALEQAKSLKAVIIDVRGNHGGSTPEQLIGALMDRPYRWWEESTPAHIGAFQLQRDPNTHVELHWFDGVEQPSEPIYKGPLFILTDGGCFSACEDFVVSFKDNHRATILGEQTAGSSGQPYQHQFVTGMVFQLSTKREFMPDGAPFEGVGIAPDIQVPLHREDLVSGHDPALDKAIALAHNSSSR